MYTNYSDILSKISEEPKWWDENGVPRFCDFHPDHKANIYAYEVKLLLICCQFCKKEFKACISNENQRKNFRWSSNHYGDPPNVGCCPAGASANCIDIRVLEYWSRVGFDWVRDHTKEIELENPDDYDD